MRERILLSSPDPSPVTSVPYLVSTYQKLRVRTKEVFFHVIFHPSFSTCFHWEYFLLESKSKTNRQPILPMSSMSRVSPNYLQLNPCFTLTVVLGA